MDQQACLKQGMWHVSFWNGESSNNVKGIMAFQWKCNRTGNRLPEELQPSSLIPRPLLDLCFSLPNGKKCNPGVLASAASDWPFSICLRWSRAGNHSIFPLGLKTLLFDQGSYSSTLWVSDRLLTHPESGELDRKHHMYWESWAAC